MLYRSILTTAVALVGLTAAAPKRSCDEKCRSSARNILLGRCNNRLLPSGCLDDLSSQAKSFCSTFLAPETVTATASATTTQVLFFTNTDTATTTDTESTTSTTVTTSTATDLATETSTVFTSTSITTAWVPPTTTVIPLAPRGLGPVVGCPEFNSTHLLALGPAKVSSLCISLGAKARTTTATSTATLTTQTSTTTTVTTTTATTTTDVTVETTLSQTTTTSVTTTTTSDLATATETIVDHCTGALTYKAAMNADGTGMLSQTISGVADAIDCCRRCWARLNCAATIFGAGSCLHLITTAAVDGTPATPMCPLGADNDYRFTPGPGTIYLGPCAAPPL